MKISDVSIIGYSLVHIKLASGLFSVISGTETLVYFHITKPLRLLGTVDGCGSKKRSN